MCLRAARREIEQKDEIIRSLEARVEKAECELRKVKAGGEQSAGKSNSIVEENVTQRLMSHAIADRDTASMFAIKSAKTRAYEKGFHEGRKVGIEKTREKLTEEVCRCENREFLHGWIEALKAADTLRAAGVQLASPLYHHRNLPFDAYEIEKSDDEGGAA
ncbi:hypothetical protein CsSME_00021908 [Camellia sinensis var. sinensis]